ERYDEPARAAFDSAYRSELQHWQALIDQLGEVYAEHYACPAFKQIAKHDYTVNEWRSTEAFIRMLGACLNGGPT
ncbi:hypothetical protein, partial [Pseudomonas guariconensis]|uniref:hypothetical protein n=1 Tax=Pseudomonas guariconensis TaxID=1288410 RepID=UPI0018A94FC2